MRNNKTTIMSNFKPLTYSSRKAITTVIENNTHTEMK